MWVPRNSPKMVYRSGRVARSGRRKLVSWSEYWLRVLPASCNLIRYGKRPDAWTDLEFTKRLYKQKGKGEAKFTERRLKLTAAEPQMLYNPSSE